MHLLGDILYSIEEKKSSCFNCSALERGYSLQCGVNLEGREDGEVAEEF